MTRFATILTGVFLLVCHTVSDVKAEEDRDQPSRPRPLVVMKQATIQGRVFFIKETGEDNSAAQLTIQVLTVDGKKKLHETKTDKEGKYTLPNLDVGEYRLIVGRLHVRLHVEEVKDDSSDRIPKVIMVFIPQDMGK